MAATIFVGDALALDGVEPTLRYASGVTKADEIAGLGDGMTIGASVEDGVGAIMMTATELDKAPTTGRLEDNAAGKSVLEGMIIAGA